MIALKQSNLNSCFALSSREQDTSFSLSDASIDHLSVVSLFILRLKDKVSALTAFFLRNFFNLIARVRTSLSLTVLIDQIELRLASERVFKYQSWYLHQLQATRRVMLQISQGCKNIVIPLQKN